MPTPISAWGAAPTLSAIKEMNRRGQKLYRAGEFWYYFRVYLPYVGRTQSHRRLAPLIHVQDLASSLCS